MKPINEKNRTCQENLIQLEKKQSMVLFITDIF